MSTLWIVDSGSPADGIRLLPVESPQNIRVNITRSTTISSIAAELRSRVPSPASRVRIVSHGGSGCLYLANGRTDISNVAAFQFLRGYVVSRTLGASIEIHGCGVASEFLPPPRREAGIGNVSIANYGNMQGELTGWGQPTAEGGRASASTSAAIWASRGVQFLKAMAHVCGVSVKGGVDYQLPDRSWQYEGPTITISPHASTPGILNDPTNRFGMGELVSF